MWRRTRFSRTFSRARWQEYRELLALAAAEDYEIVALEDWLDRPVRDRDRTLILRHDVDQDPSSALSMCAVEREHGVTATWYFRWRTATPAVVAEVRATGAGVGLHYETLTRLALERGASAAEATALVPIAREELRQEIAMFRSRFGPIRSVCPHGDTRAPGVRNAALLEGEDCSAYGVEFDGNAAMAGHRLGFWLTDRVGADGSWAHGASPSHLFGTGVTPILCVIHPNNWSSGLSLWTDRIARGFGDRIGLGRRRAPSDRPGGRHG